MKAADPSHDWPLAPPAPQRALLIGAHLAVAGVVAALDFYGSVRWVLLLALAVILAIQWLMLERRRGWRLSTDADDWWLTDPAGHSRQVDCRVAFRTGTLVVLDLRGDRRRWRHVALFSSGLGREGWRQLHVALRKMVSPG